MFTRIDASADGRVDLAEFALAVPKLREWGVEICAEDVEKTFREVDADGAGSLLFDEFCDWAIKNNLDLEDDDDANDV